MSPATAPGATGWLRDKIATLRHYHRVAEVGEIARRYFAMNAFDGVLTTLGVLVGSYIGRVHSAHQVIAVGLGAAVAMGISGFYGSYLIERAERDRSLRELEDVTLSSLEDSDIAAASTYATIVIACVDGISPFVAAALVLLPFFFGSVVSLNAAYVSGVVIAFVELFALGLFLGRVSRQRLIWSGMKLAVAGVLCLALSALLDWGLR
jgi:predicted membrane protein (TIGR00267 family)